MKFGPNAAERQAKADKRDLPIDQPTSGAKSTDDGQDLDVKHLIGDIPFMHSLYRWVNLKGEGQVETFNLPVPQED
jgi:hypothetical protein